MENPAPSEFQSMPWVIEYGAPSMTDEIPLKPAKTMTYEEYLDEVTTLITEKYNLEDEDAIALVMAAQDQEYFCPHDEDPGLRTLDNAHVDARHLFKERQRLLG